MSIYLLEYIHLDTRGVEKAYHKVKAFLTNGDFYSAEVKKLKPTPYYRAKLNDADRLLFKFVQYQGQTVILLLEVIRQHAYEKSKFLRGATVDESQVVEPLPIPTETLAYLNPQRPYFHLLDKVIAFDELQHEIYQWPLPLVLIGSAGSGKTALTLEKLKTYSGRILYVTHSPYLVQHARNLYYAQEDGNEQAEIDFLSYHELLETVQIPTGREVSFSDFSAWAAKMGRHAVLKDPHQLFEEFKGVITGAPIEQAYLSRVDYLNLGIKQSIYLVEERSLVYDLFEKYLMFLKTNGYYDLNLVSHHYLARCQPRYDTIVADEIQDFTNVQLIFILKFLKNPQQFLLCGDANQIVHPNFFSWARIKTLFYQGALGDDHAVTRILYTNYRNSAAVTSMANQLLKIKNARLGSVDKESHYLIQSQSTAVGSVAFLPVMHALVKELNQKTQQSTHYAVVVIRDEYKERARRYFQTPLIFSIFETKGLEYDHIILFDFISAESEAFREIVYGVTAEDLAGDLTYRRAKEKSDKSLEIYKFYINALYVAITRSRQNIYWIESQEKHRLYDLLNLKTLHQLSIEKAQSSTEEWQREARKLDLQGKQEQADAIRAQLHQQHVPWQVMTPAIAADLIEQVTTRQMPKSVKIQCLEYAIVYQQQVLIQRLAQQGLSAAQQWKKSADIVEQKYYGLYGSQRNLSTAQQAVKKYGVDFRNPFNQTMLMIAARAGNAALVQWLLDVGADSSLTDNQGRQAFDYILQQAFDNKLFIQKALSNLYAMLAPDHLSFQVDQRLIKIDRKLGEFLLYYIVNTMLRQEISSIRLFGFTAQDLVQRLQDFPESIVPDYRKKRTYLSSLLSKNEATGKNPYNRQLFKRIRMGHYKLNPTLQIRTHHGWQAISLPDST